jgi:hypothetical protein
LLLVDEVVVVVELFINLLFATGVSIPVNNQEKTSSSNSLHAGALVLLALVLVVVEVEVEFVVVVVVGWEEELLFDMDKTVLIGDFGVTGRRRSVSTARETSSIMYFI